jgi:hypothetical protein
MLRLLASKPTLALLTTIAVAGGSAGCTSSTKPAPPATLSAVPAAGHAGVWLRDSQSTLLAQLEIAGEATGLSGDVYLVNGCRRGGIRIDAQRSVASFGTPGTPSCPGTSGFVMLGDGSVLTGTNHHIERLAPPDQSTSSSEPTAVAGSDHARAAGEPVPASSDAATVQFTDTVFPIGVRPDGSIIVLDSDVVWALKGGQATRLYADPLWLRDNSGLKGAVDLGAVDSEGNIYADFGAGRSLTADRFIEIASDGGTRPIPFDGTTSDFAPLSMSSDGANGLLVLGDKGIGKAGSRKLLRFSNGAWTTVLAETSFPNGAQCPATFDPAAVPCPLPTYVTATHDMALLAGGFGSTSVLAVGLPH